jgi:hypothetical protein
MNTPGRCTNTEFCWVGNSGRTVHVLLGADFVCPACNRPLRPPTDGRLSVGPAVRKAAVALGALSVLSGLTIAVYQTVQGASLPHVGAWVTTERAAMAALLAPRPRSAEASAALVVPREEALLGPAPARYHDTAPWPGRGASAIGAQTFANLVPPNQRADRAPPDSATHAWSSVIKSENWLLHGHDWVADGGTDPRAPGQAEQGALAAAGTDPTGLRASGPAVSETTPVPKVTQGADQLAAQAPEAVRPPSLFGRASAEAESASPASAADDLPVSVVEQASEPDPAIYAFAGSRRAATASVAQRRALPDALRVALSAQTEHVNLPVTAAPALPRYPALFAQEYPEGRVSAVCLLAAAGEQPDCKVLGTGTSISMTESVGAWPKAGKVHYRAIAANAQRAEAAWKPKTVHS